jgi:hypothetical protein
LSKQGGWREIDAKSHESLTRFFVRTGEEGGGRYEPTSSDMPFDRMLDVPLVNGHLAELARLDEGSFHDLIARVEDGEAELGEYEIQQRIKGALLLVKFMARRSPHPWDVYRQFAAIARGMHISPWCEMTMEEVALMEGQSKAAHSFRCKVISGEIELAGMRGSRMPGQKTKSASESYKKQRKGNNNRKGGKKAAKRAQRQQSFLRKLKVQPTPKHHHE